MTHQKLEIEELITSFQEFLIYEKGLSKNTVEAYKSDAKRYRYPNREN